MEVETRIIFLGTGRYIENVAIFATDDTGQWRVVEAWDQGPFTTRREMLQRVERAMMKMLDESVTALA